MASVDVSLAGAVTLGNNRGTGIWHCLGDSSSDYQYGGLKASGTLTFTRNSVENKSISIVGTIYNTIAGNRYYPFPIYCALVKGGIIYNTKNYYDTFNKYISNGDIILDLGTFSAPGSVIGSSSSLNIDITTEYTINDIIYICYKCGQSDGRIEGCSVGYDGSSSHPHSDWVIVGTLNTNLIPYEPYKVPTILISTDQSINIYNEQRSILIARNTSGDQSATNVSVNVNGNIENTNIGNGEAYYNFTPSNKGVSDGNSYTVQATRTHSKNSNFKAESNKLTLYTYRTPIIESFDLSNYNFSGIGNTQLTWFNNTRRWGNDYEASFTTSIKFGDKSWFLANNQNPTNNIVDNTLYQQTENLNKEIIDNQFTVNERSQESISTTIQMMRKNISSGVEATSSTRNITIQMFPKYIPFNLYFYSSNIEGQVGNLIEPESTIFIDQVPYILVDWYYPENTDRGVIDGYIMTLYANSDYSEKIIDYVINTTSLNASQLINVLDLKRGITNYIEIKAFYNKPDGSGRAESSSLRSVFVKPVSRLNKPFIDYPKTGIWHNKNFRICFQLPEDNDIDTYDFNINNYTYKNIEIKINNQIYTYNVLDNFNPGITTMPIIFSCVDLVGYKKYIVINPSYASNFLDSNSYEISIRVQKNYYSYDWSEWSDSVIVQNIAISELNLIKNELILADHYNTVQNYIDRLYQVYPFNNRPNSKLVNKGDIIFGNNFNSIFNTILGIQNLVNTYTTFERDNINFNIPITEFKSPNEVTQEIITSQLNPKPLIEGRNYFNLLIQAMNKLK